MDLMRSVSPKPIERLSVKPRIIGCMRLPLRRAANVCICDRFVARTADLRDGSEVGLRFGHVMPLRSFGSDAPLPARRFEPGEPSSGFTFVSEIKGGAVPKEYIPGVVKVLLSRPSTPLVLGRFRPRCLSNMMSGKSFSSGIATLRQHPFLSWISGWLLIIMENYVVLRHDFVDLGYAADDAVVCRAAQAPMRCCSGCTSWGCARCCSHKSRGLSVSCCRQGLEEMMSNGALAGFPVVDIKATLHDGSYHDVDSSVLAFQVTSSDHGRVQASGSGAASWPSRVMHPRPRAGSSESLR